MLITWKRYKIDAWLLFNIIRKSYMDFILVTLNLACIHIWYICHLKSYSIYIGSPVSPHVSLCPGTSKNKIATSQSSPNYILVTCITYSAEATKGFVFTSFFNHWTSRKSTVQQSLAFQIMEMLKWRGWYFSSGDR